MWAAHCRLTEDLGNEEHQGDPGIGRPTWCIMEMGHDICHGPFPLIFCTSNKLIQLVSLKRQLATKKKMATATTAATTTTRTTTTTEQPPPWPTWCQQYSPTMSSAERQPNVNQRAQQRPNKQTYTSQQPIDDQRGQQPPSNHIPAIDNAYLPSAILTCHRQPAEAALHRATWKLLKVALSLQWELQALFHNGGPTSYIHRHLSSILFSNFQQGPAQHYVA